MSPYEKLLLVAEAVRSVLTSDLLREPYRSRTLSGCAKPFEGHCYVASEALWHLIGGRAGPVYLQPAFVRVREEIPHWYLRSRTSKDVVVDVTRDQFPDGVPYEKGIGKGFLTKRPSKRAREVMKRVLRDAKVARALGMRKER